MAQDHRPHAACRLLHIQRKLIATCQLHPLHLLEHAIFQRHCHLAAACLAGQSVCDMGTAGLAGEYLLLWLLCPLAAFHRTLECTGKAHLEIMHADPFRGDEDPCHAGRYGSHLV